MFENKKCSNSTELGCYFESGLGVPTEHLDEWLEETVWYGMRMWHVIFLSIGAVLSIVILLCCCFKFRIPRTKQEIEGDYIRRKIMRKFRKRLKAIQNQELDEMDLKKALDKIRTELKSDTESLQQSDVLSGATLSSAGGVNPAAGSTYRRASQIQIDISLEDLRIQSLGLGARIALAFTRFFGRSNRPTKGADSDEENGGNEMGDIGSDKPTTALLPPKKQGGTTITSKLDGEDTNKKKKGDKDEQKGKGSATGTESKVEPAATTSKEKSTKNVGKDEEKNKKEKKKESTSTTPATTGTTVVTTEKETGSSDKKPEKKTNNKEDNKGKKEKEQNKSKTGGGPVAGTKEATDKAQAKTTDKKNNESQPKK